MKGAEHCHLSLILKGAEHNKPTFSGSETNYSFLSIYAHFSADEVKAYQKASCYFQLY